MCYQACRAQLKLSEVSPYSNDKYDNAFPKYDPQSSPIACTASASASQFTPRIPPITGTKYSDVTAFKVVNVNKPADGFTVYVYTVLLMAERSQDIKEHMGQIL